MGGRMGGVGRGSVVRARVDRDVGCRSGGVSRGGRVGSVGVGW